MRGDEARWPDLFKQTSELWTTRRGVSGLSTTECNTHCAATCGSRDEAGDVTVMDPRTTRAGQHQMDDGTCLLGEDDGWG